MIMASSRLQLVLLARLSATLIGAPLVTAQADYEPFPGLSCPKAGYAVEKLVGGLYAGYVCVENPCDPSPCGTGNTCTVREGTVGDNIFFYVADCQCDNASYTAAPLIVANKIQVNTCYIPGQDVCSPNPCQNGGACSYAADMNGVQKGPDGTPIAAVCACPTYSAYGHYCQLTGYGPAVETTVDGITGPLAQSVAAPYSDIYCGETDYPYGCLSQDQLSYVCCTVGCGPIGPDGNTPLCRGDRFIPTPSTYVEPAFPPTPPSDYPGDCGYGYATDYTVQCNFNNDLQGRYICCDTAGCNGFSPADNTTPLCKNKGYVPPGYGVIGLLPQTPVAQPPAAPVLPPEAQPPSVPPAPVPTPASAPGKTLVPPSTACPPVDGFYTNSCYNEGGTMHVCCINPDSCGPFTADGNPTCTNGQYYVFPN